MILRIENQPLNKDEWRLATAKEKIKALEEMADLWIAKYEETKASICLRRARDYRVRAQMLKAYDAGLFRANREKHYSAGDFKNYLDAIKDDVKDLLDTATKIAKTSREHGYSFNPSSIDCYSFIRLMARGSIALTEEEREIEDNSDMQAVSKGELTLFD